jgi:hypothetical protein
MPEVCLQQVAAVQCFQMHARENGLKENCLMYLLCCAGPDVSFAGQEVLVVSQCGVPGLPASTSPVLRQRDLGAS